jgi:Leucine-rich repeat (LRR) protein
MVETFTPAETTEVDSNSVPEDASAGQGTIS